MAVRTSNEEIQDAAIRHIIGLLRVSATLRARLVELIDATEGELRVKIEDALDSLGPAPFSNKADLRRLERLDQTLRALRLDAWAGAYDKLTEELGEIVKNEPQFMAALLETSAPTIVQLALPADDVLAGIVKNYPIQGRVLSAWMENLKANDVQRINSAIRMGLIQNETSRQIVRRIVGTKEMNGADGVTEVSRRDVTTIVRTSVTALSQASRDAFHARNTDIITDELFVATLDSRTTVVCASLDGNHYHVGEGPKPPLHMNCRSIRIALLNGTFLGTRPFKASTERELISEYAKEHGLGPLSSRDDLPRGHKGAFDQFARRRVRELTGSVPSKTTYAEFFERQSRAFQDEALGVKKAQLYRDGGLTLDRFVDVHYQEMTLAELALREREAFIRAGLDPDRF